MAKFCGNCGVQLDDEARVCGQCGMSVDGRYGNLPQLKTVDPQKKKMMMKKVKVIIVLAMVILFVAAGIKIAQNFTAAKGLVRKVMAAYEKYDIDTLVSLSSDVYTTGDDENYVEEYFKGVVGQNIDDFESSVGHSYKMSYEVVEIYNLSQRRMDEVLENLEIFYPDFNRDSINKIAVAEIEVTVKQGKKAADRSLKISMTKEGNTWKILYLE